MKTIDLVRFAERGSEAQKLWALVLMLAIKDRATKVWYDPAKGDDQLGYEIDGTPYALVPPPESMQGELAQVMAHVVRRRSAWEVITGLFRPPVERTTPLEGAFMVQIAGHRIPVTAALDSAGTHVLLQIAPEAQAAPAARAALEMVLTSQAAAD